METIEHIKLMVEQLGGQTKAATALKVKQPTVNGWLSGKHGISPIVAMRAEKLIGIPAEKLCPSMQEVTPAA